jgi:hypothetical protein
VQRLERTNERTKEKTMTTIDLDNTRLADCGSLAWSAAMERLTTTAAVFAATGRRRKDAGPAAPLSAAARASVDEAVSEALALMLGMSEDTLLGEAMAYGAGCVRRALLSVDAGRTVGGSRAPLRESGEMPAEVTGAEDLWTPEEREEQVREVFADIGECAETHRATLAHLAVGERQPGVNPDAWHQRVSVARRELREVRRVNKRLTPTPRTADASAADRRRREQASARQRLTVAARIADAEAWIAEATAR